MNIRLLKELRKTVNENVKSQISYCDHYAAIYIISNKKRTSVWFDEFYQGYEYFVEHKLKEWRRWYMSEIVKQIREDKKRKSARGNIWQRIKSRWTNV
jgi:hypothetical protein